MESFVLSNGMNIPAIGFGCYALNPPEQKRILLDAIEAGYRHFDTASFYQTEEALGQAVRESGIPRESFFLTTKLWRTQMDDPDSPGVVFPHHKTLAHPDGRPSGGL